MQALTQQRLAASAYRTLGVSASAGQSAVEAAARRMRIWPDPQRIPPTPWDLPWLGPIARARTDIEQAAARLNDPAARVEERLVWYLGERLPAEVAPGNVGVAPPPATPAGPAACVGRHDAALAALHMATVVDATAVDVGRWRDVLRRFVDLAAAPDLAAWLVAAEEDGHFDKRASPAEIEAAVRALPGAVTVAIVATAQAKLDRNNVAGGAAVVAMVREVARPQDVAAALRGMLDRLEDTLEMHCRQTDDELRDRLLTNRQTPEPYYADNRLATHKSAAFYNNTVRQALDRLRAVAGDAEEERARVTRALSLCADLLGLIALGWEWSGEFVTAEETLLAALALAEGSPAAIALEKDLQRVRPLAERQRNWSGELQSAQQRWSGADGLSGGLSSLGSGGHASTFTTGGSGVAPRPVITIPPAPQPSRRKAALKVLLVVICAVVFGGLRIASMNSGSKRNQPYQYYRPPTAAELDRRAKAARDRAAAATQPMTGWDVFLQPAQSAQSAHVGDPSTDPDANGDTSREP